jgi:omega-hydroxy-beta-dihydromenaquinone-9 sulfotransferase
MRISGVKPPLFIVGCGRSGTTIVYELLCEHPDLAWFSNYAERWPALPQLEALTRLRDIGTIRRSPSRFVPQPVEGYALWDRSGPPDVRRRNARLSGADVDAEHAQRVGDLVAAHVRYHKGRRFINKNTRNSRRVRYLDAIFPDAAFLHVIRDPRAVVASLLAVHWWPDLPLWWSDDRTPRALAAAGSTPEAVAAEHWVKSVERLLADARHLPPSRYLEIRYEAFTESPETVLSSVCTFAGLSSSARITEALRRRTVSSQNVKYKSQFGDEALRTVELIVAPLAARLGYRIEADEGLENGHGDHQEGPRPVTRG